MYKLSNKAVEDFGSIFEYTLQNFGEAQADLYTEDLEYCLKALSEFPLIGRDCKEIRVGVYRHDHKQHAIFYRIRKQHIFVIRILHQRCPI